MTQPSVAGNDEFSHRTQSNIVSNEVQKLVIVLSALIKDLMFCKCLFFIINSNLFKNLI